MIISIKTQQNMVNDAVLSPSAIFEAVHFSAG